MTRLEALRMAAAICRERRAWSAEECAEYLEGLASDEPLIDRPQPYYLIERNDRGSHEWLACVAGRRETWTADAHEATHWTTREIAECAAANYRAALRLPGLHVTEHTPPALSDIERIWAREDAAWGAAFSHRLAVLGHGLTVTETREDGTRVESVVDARVQARRYADEVAEMAREAHS